MLNLKLFNKSKENAILPHRISIIDNKEIIIAIVDGDIFVRIKDDVFVCISNKVNA